MAISPVVSDSAREQGHPSAFRAPGHSEPAELSRALFPPDVAVAWGDVREGAKALFREEEAHVAAAIDKRRIEFAKGRELARTALERLGVPPVAILPGPRREPIWPAEVVGSISHSEALCAAAVARSASYAGIGVDAEFVRPLSSDVARRICSSEEAATFSELDADFRDLAPLLVFSVKESIYKCLFPLVQRFIPFEAVHVTLGSGVFDALARDASLTELVARVRGRFRRRGEYVITSAWVAR